LIINEIVKRFGIKKREKQHFPFLQNTHQNFPFFQNILTVFRNTIQKRNRHFIVFKDAQEFVAMNRFHKFEIAT
jgi:hypothetical protein